MRLLGTGEEGGKKGRKERDIPVLYTWHLKAEERVRKEGSIPLLQYMAF
jgi:hypothetical protein